MTLQTEGSALGAISTRSIFCSSAMRRASRTPNRPSCEPSTPIRRQVRAEISPLMRGSSDLAIADTFLSLAVACHIKENLPAREAAARRHGPKRVNSYCLTRQLLKAPQGGDACASRFVNTKRQCTPQTACMQVGAALRYLFTAHHSRRALSSYAALWETFIPANIRCPAAWHLLH